MNITKWISLNKYFVLAEEERAGLGFSRETYYGELREIIPSVPKECEDCLLFGTDDCDSIEDPDKCVSFYYKYKDFDSIKPLKL